MPTVLITGANRGLGLGFARRYAAEGWRVVATCRHPEQADELNAIAGDVSIQRMDVADEGSIRAVAEAFGDAPLDLLVNNAGILGPTGGTSVDHGGRGQSLRDPDFQAWLRVLDVNAVGPVRVAHAFLPHLEKAGGKIVSITSGMGSISRTSGGYYAYRMSKAALNMSMRNMAADLRGRGVTVVAVNPGWIQTDMGGSGANLSIEESVRRLSNLAARLTPADSGKFFSHDGSEYPW